VKRWVTRGGQCWWPHAGVPECGATAASCSCPAACPDCAYTRHLASSRTPALLQPRSQTIIDAQCLDAGTDFPSALRCPCLQPRSHTIIEAHPDVYKYACSQGWDSKPGVRLLLGRWQDVIDQVGFGGEARRRAAARLWRVLWPAIALPLCGMLFPQPPAAAWLLLLPPPHCRLHQVHPATAQTPALGFVPLLLLPLAAGAL
jgi:hypothetical protein